jgi:glyceraldehyde-3-phosphate dehydrogenase (NADP+)|tara:strand:+ start:852 stop:2273 length:1422 start_codon:yes stop_codon:yes gene_type:complete
MPKTQNVIIDKIHKIEVPVYNSFTGDKMGTVSQSTEQDVFNALDSAKIGESIGKKMSASERIAILRKAVIIMEREFDVLSNFIATEGIKTISQARREVTRALNTMQLSAEEAGRISGATIPFNAVTGSEDRVGYEFKVPIGIVIAITPFNDPLNLVCHKLGPAIAAGNPVILKPSDYTPLVAIKFGEILYESGLPKEMLSIITGSPEHFGDALLRDDRIRLISFTGGVEAAKIIQKKAGLKKLAMELGSNSPVIVLSDADLEEAVQSCVSGAFYASGQNCVGVKRIFVEETIYDSFLHNFSQLTSTLKMGSPLSEDVDIGPIISKESIHQISDFITESMHHGAKIVSGGKTIGNCYVPTILESDCMNDIANCLEVFGPVVTISKVKNLDQAIVCCNKSPFGLHSAIFTNNINNAYKAINELDCSGVMVNDSTDYRIDAMPFGGVKSSGVGREGVKSAIEAMSETKVVCLKLKI